MELVGPFTTREAAAAGMTRAQLRGQLWQAPFRGVRDHREAPRNASTLCRSLAAVLPKNAVFSGLTAARLLGWWLPYGVSLDPLEVTVRPDQLIARKNVVCARSVVGPAEIVERDGLKVTSGVRTLLDLAADWPLVDLVVMADSAVRFGDCTLDELATAAQATRRRRGVRTFRRMTKLVDARSESPMETAMRLGIVLPGLPPPRPQAVVRDGAGGWLARVDLLGADGWSIFEYDGAEHVMRDRHANDVARWKALHRAGFRVYPYTAREFLRRPHQVTLDYIDALGLPSAVGDVDAWVTEFRLSSFGRRRR
jgi:hypothetical protein